MKRDQPFDAVIADMDGVLTRTARLHERAWKEVFDALLAERQGQRPFSRADYRDHVDGKPRYDGVADFLESRGLELRRGEPSDAPNAHTVCGVGNRKNARFGELLARDGVDVFDDAVTALGRWRRGGAKVAIVSSSRNCRRVLDAARLTRCADVIVEGELAAELGLDGKAGILAEAARRLGVAPADAVVVEDATAGVRAGRREGFGLVVGVARGDDTRDLEEAGAHVVVRRLDRLRFPRRVPSALERLPELVALRAGRPLAVFLDHDGTLAPIVDDPGDAGMSDAMRASVTALARRVPVAIISGRDREDVAARVACEGLVYAGNHGFDIAGPGHEMTLPEAEAAVGHVQDATEELERRLGGLDGVVIEPKRFSVAVHYRMVRSEDVMEEIERAVEELRAQTGLRRREGKKVVELEPAVDWDKGRALQWLADALPNVPPGAFLMYVGDDETDEDAFAALQGRGVGVRVGGAVSDTLADYRVADTEEVRALIDWLAG